MSSSLLDPRVLELLASRLCHDIISPVTAINNGVELVTELGADMGKDAMGLIGNSARQALDRLEFFRAAVGAGGAETLTDMKKLKKLADGYLAHGKSSIAWPPEPVPPAILDRRGGGRALLNLLVIAADAMPRGGSVSLEVNDDHATLTARGTPSQFSDDVIAALEGTVAVDALSSPTVTPYVAGLFARQAGFSLSIVSRAEPASVTLAVAPV